MAEYSDLIGWLDRLQRARATGLRSVYDSDGSRVEYRTDAELQAGINYVNSLLYPQKTHTIKFTSSKGLYR